MACIRQTQPCRSSSAQVHIAAHIQLWLPKHGVPWHTDDDQLLPLFPAGTNCCYVDQLSNIGKFHVNFRHLSRTSDMVVNTV